MSASYRPLNWSSDESRPTCQANKCVIRAYWIIRIPVTRDGRPLSRESWRCNVHAREWAERHDLKFPPAEVAS